MSRTNLKHIKRILVASIICATTVLGFSNFKGIKSVKAIDEPEYNYDDVSTYVDNEYDSYVEEKTNYHNVTHPGVSLYPGSLSEHIDAFDYYLKGTTIFHNDEYVATKAIVTNGYLFKEMNGVNSANFTEDLYTLVDYDQIDKSVGVSL